MKKITQRDIAALEAKLACAEPVQVAKLVKKLMKAKNNFVHQDIEIDE